MIYHVKQRVLVTLEFDIELHETTDPGKVLETDQELTSYLSNDSSISHNRDIDQIISVEIYKEGEDNYPDWTYENKSIADG